MLVDRRQSYMCNYELSFVLSPLCPEQDSGSDHALTRLRCIARQLARR